MFVFFNLSSLSVKNVLTFYTTISYLGKKKEILSLWTKKNNKKTIK